MNKGVLLNSVFVLILWTHGSEPIAFLHPNFGRAVLIHAWPYAGQLGVILKLMTPTLNRYYEHPWTVFSWVILTP